MTHFKFRFIVSQFIIPRVCQRLFLTSLIILTLVVGGKARIRSLQTILNPIRLVPPSKKQIKK